VSEIEKSPHFEDTQKGEISRIFAALMYTRRGTGKRVEEVSKPDRKCSAL